MSLVLSFPQPCRVPDEDTQQGKILRHLRNGGSLTVAEALSMFGCYALSQRIGELKRAGWPIIAERYKTPGGAVVARYSMARAA
jgi:hypothetical protein